MIKLKDIYNEIKLIQGKNWDKEWYAIRDEVAEEYGVDLEDEDELENYEDKINRETDTRFENKFGFSYYDVMKESNTTGSGVAGATFNSGVGEQYATPKAFGKKKKKKYSNSGYTEVDPKLRFKAKTFDVVNWKSNKPKYFK